MLLDFNSVLLYCIISSCFDIDFGPTVFKQQGNSITLNLLYNSSVNFLSNLIK